MELNEDNPGQHLAIVVVGGALIVFHLIMAFKDARRGDTTTNPQGTVQPLTQVVDESTGQIVETATQHRNPTLSWSELIFCRGLKRSSWCSYRELHPDTVEADANDVQVADGNPAKDHVVAYRGPMVRDSIFSGRVSLPEQDLSPKYLDLESKREDNIPIP